MAGTTVSNITPVNPTVATGLLDVGPGSNPPTTFPDSSKGKVAGVWGYVGPLLGSPSQTSSPPIDCGIFGQGGILGVNGYTGAIEDADAAGDGLIGFGATNGVHGISPSGTGVTGASTSGKGVFGSSKSNYGVGGTSESGIGVRGDTTDGVAGVVGVSNGKGLAGRFDGNVQINGDIAAVNTVTVKKNIQIDGDITSVNTITVQKDVIMTGGDCAEQFDVHAAESPAPGSVVVIDDEGMLRECRIAYDRRVAGVVSGAGEYRPAIILDRRENPESRATVALIGKVYCKVDADSAPIAVGDLLTTAPRPGFAMKAADPSQAFGAVIGKALKPLPAGQGLIPILVALQ